MKKQIINKIETINTIIGNAFPVSNPEILFEGFVKFKKLDTEEQIKDYADSIPAEEVENMVNKLDNIIATLSDKKYIISLQEWFEEQNKEPEYAELIVKMISEWA